MCYDHVNGVEKKTTVNCSPCSGLVDVLNKWNRTLKIIVWDCNFLIALYLLRHLGK